MERSSGSKSDGTSGRVVETFGGAVEDAANGARTMHDAVVVIQWLKQHELQEGVERYLLYAKKKTE